MRSNGEFFDLLFNGLPLTPQHVEEVAHLWCQFRFRVLKNICHGGLEQNGSLKVSQI